MIFQMPIKSLIFLCSLAILLVKIECMPNGNDDLSSLNEQIKLRDPYGALSDYLVEQRNSVEFEVNQKVAKQLTDHPDFERLIESLEFKEIIKLMVALRTDSDELCAGSNLANLRELAGKMKQYNMRPTEGREASQRLNRLLIEYSQRVYSHCLLPLQDEWSVLDLEMNLLDDNSRLALASLETEVDFVQLVRSEYNSNLANEYQFAQGVQCVLDHLHAKRTGERVARERAEIASRIEFYLMDPCARLRRQLHSAAAGKQAEVAQKYLDLATVAILMYPKVLTKEDERNNFVEIRVKRAGRVVVCNKLLDGAGSEVLADKLLRLAKSELSSNSKRTCKL